jgi:hypothetical protein
MATLPLHPAAVEDLLRRVVGWFASRTTTPSKPSELSDELVDRIIRELSSVELLSASDFPLLLDDASNQDEARREWIWLCVAATLFYLLDFGLQTMAPSRQVTAARKILARHLGTLVIALNSARIVRPELDYPNRADVLSALGGTGVAIPDEAKVALEQVIDVAIAAVPAMRIVIRISPRAYLLAMWNLFWSAIRHPFSETTIDLSTGRVLYRTCARQGSAHA